MAVEPTFEQFYLPLTQRLSGRISQKLAQYPFPIVTSEAIRLLRSFTCPARTACQGFRGSEILHTDEFVNM